MLIFGRDLNESGVAIVSPHLMKSLLESIGAVVDLPDDADQVEPLLITSKVAEFRRDRVRIGYDATFNGRQLGPELPIHRGEVWGRIMKEQGK